MEARRGRTHYVCFSFYTATTVRSSTETSSESPWHTDTVLSSHVVPCSLSMSTVREMCTLTAMHASARAGSFIASPASFSLPSVRTSLSPIRMMISANDMPYLPHRPSHVRPETPTRRDRGGAHDERGEDAGGEEDELRARGARGEVEHDAERVGGLGVQDRAHDAPVHGVLVQRFVALRAAVDPPESAEEQHCGRWAAG